MFFELVILGRRDELSSFDLRYLKAQQLELTEPLSVVTAEFVEALREVALTQPRFDERGDVDAAEQIERGSLGRCCRERGVAVLTMQLDQARPVLGQRCRSGQPPVDVRARSPFAGHDALQHQLFALEQEATLDNRFVPWGPTSVASARPPTSNSSAVSTSVLPAPVSPVIAVMPGSNTSPRCSITPRFVAASSMSWSAPVALTRRSAQTWFVAPDGSSSSRTKQSLLGPRRRAGDRLPNFELAHDVPIDSDHRIAVFEHGDAHGVIG